MRVPAALPLVLFLAVACGPAGSSPSIDSGDTDVNPVVPGDDDDDTVPPVTTNPQEPGLWGTLVGADGQPLDHYEVMACSANTCLNGVTAADGSFAFLTAPGTQLAVKTHEEVSGTHPRGVALEPCLVMDGPSVDLGTVYVPDLPEGVALGDADPQEIPLGDGLELTLSAADLVAPFGVFLHEIGASLLPAEHVPVYEELDGEEIVAVYAMYPFSTGSSSPIGVRLPTTLPAGTKVNVRTIGYIDGAFSEAAAATSDGTSLETDPGEGIYDLTHLVISLP